MSNIQRSRTISTGDITINEGDVIITNPANGIVLEDNVGDQNRIKVIDDDGVKTIEVEEIA